MRIHGYIILSALILSIVSGSRLLHQYSAFWLVILAVAISVGLLTFILGIFPKESDDDTLLDLGVNTQDRIGLDQAMDEYLSSTNSPKKSPEWESQG